MTTSFHRIEPSLGKVKSLGADPCKHIKEVMTTSCATPPNSGVYWVKDIQVTNSKTILDSHVYDRTV